MASLAESSMGSVPIDEIRAAQRRLNNYKPLIRDEHPHVVPPSDSDITALDGNGSSSKDSIVPESIQYETRIPKDSLPRARRVLLSASEPALEEEKMLAMIEGEREPLPKARSFAFDGGDTQPWDSQEVVERSKSMIGLGKRTPQKAVSAPDLTPGTYESGPETDQSIPIDLGLDDMSPPTSQAARDFIGNETQTTDLRREDMSPTTSQAERDLLRDDTKPRTQIGASPKQFPATPAMAGRKHSRDGELLTSATTVVKTPHYSQFFVGDKPLVMTNTQLFGASESSPALGAPRSDPILSRPSPNVNGLRTPSSPAAFSSPLLHIQPERASSTAVGDPISHYKTMHESQEERDKRLASERLEKLRKRGDNFEFDELDEMPNPRRRRGVKRVWSETDGLSKIKAPARSGSRPRSAGKVIEIHDTPVTVTKKRWNELVDHASGEQPAAEEEDEQDIDDTQELPEEPNVEFSERDDPPEAGEHDEHHDDAQQDDDEENDEYDEYAQTLRSQSQFELDYEDHASANDHIDQDEDMGDACIDEDHEGVTLGGGSRYGPSESTQISTIADSQPTAQQSEARSASQQAVQYSSYVPGSQHQGKTSQEMALLNAPQASNQSRVPASQIQAEQSTERSKIPSSPPVPMHAGTVPQDSAGASIAGRNLHEQFQCQDEQDNEDAEHQEEPESDILDVSRPQTATIQEDSIPFYSTARTHVSASAQSPAKRSLAASPRKPLDSQRSRLTDQSPAIRKFSEIAALPSLPMDPSFDAHYSQPDVLAMTNVFFTVEDQAVEKIMSNDHTDSPRRKRIKCSHASSIPTGSIEDASEPIRGVSTLQHNSANGTRTIQDLVPEATTSRSVEQQSSEPAFLGEDSTQKPLEEQRNKSHPILKDSPNKANQMSTGLTDDDDEGEKVREIPESVRLREEAGRAAVSQLVASRTSAKKSKQKTYSRASRGKFSRSDVQTTGKGRKPRALTLVTDGDDDEHSVGEDTECIEDAPVMDIRGLVEGKAPADETMVDNEQLPAEAHDAGSTELLDTPTVGRDGMEGAVGTKVTAPERVWAFFRGTPQNIYTATWLGASPDGMTYKIKFDDQTVTNIEVSHVRSLELRIGDSVKVDEADKRKKNWTIVGFGPIATTEKERALGTDVFGHTHVKVQLKGNRESLSKSASSTKDAEMVHTVLVNYLYLTNTMWPHYKERSFEPPNQAPAPRPQTPLSACTSTSSAIGTPASRSRRAPGPLGKIMAGRTSHLRETSVASSSSALPTAIFSGMAFALSYVSTGEEKKEISQLIQQNGGTILEDGFEELFDLPDIGVSDIVSPTKDSPRKKDNDNTISGLQLSSKGKGLKFVALIADRHSRRAKYMQALALGLPTISGLWVVHSLDEMKNPSRDNIGPLSWDRYLLPAGESTYLSAIRSRTITIYDAASASLVNTIQNRTCLLNAEGLILVAPKTGAANWEKRKTFAFLTMACGAGHVKRVHDVQEAKKLLLDDRGTWKWVYIDTSVAEAENVLFGRGAAAAGKKRKRTSQAGNASGEEKMSATNGVVKIVNDEFVIQSLILEALVE